jgi:hypothetical protein
MNLDMNTFILMVMNMDMNMDIARDTDRDSNRAITRTGTWAQTGNWKGQGNRQNIDRVGQGLGHRYGQGQG